MAVHAKILAPCVFKVQKWDKFGLNVYLFCFAITANFFSRINNLCLQVTLMHFINSYINCSAHSTVNIYNSVLHNCRRNLENANPQTLSPQFHVMFPTGFELLLTVMLHLFSTISGALAHFKKFDSHLIASHKYDHSNQIYLHTCIRNLLSRSSVHNNN